MFSALLIGGLVLSAISAAVGVTTSIVASQEQANLQKAQARARAESLREEAEQEEQNQLQRSIVERRQAARKVAAADAQYAASGVSLGGTPTNSLAAMSGELELETQMQEAASGRKRSLLLAEADNTKMFGDWGAGLTRTSGTLSGVGSGLGSLGQMAGMAYTGYKDGALGGKNKK